MSDGRKFLHGQVVAMDLATLDAYQHILATVDADKLEKLAARHLGQDPQAAAPSLGQAGAVAVIPVYGMLQPRRDVFMMMFGGTSIMGLTAAFRNAMADPGIKAVVLDVHSPGGSVYGITELAREIRAARGRKPIVSVVNAMAASAAYWLASSADEVVMTPSGEAGSIGCYCVHVNEKKAAEGIGLEVTLFSAGELKPAESGVSPLSQAERDAWQARVDHPYAQFTADVAKNRGVSVDAVRKGYGRGAVLPSTPAKAEGMVDRIATLDETLARLSSGPGRRSAMSTGAATKERVIALGLPADEVPEQLGEDPEDVPPPVDHVVASAATDPRTRRLRAKLKAMR